MSRRDHRRSFGSVRKLPSGSYQASYWHEGKRHVAPHTFTTVDEASAWLTTEHAKILERRWHNPDAGSVLFSVYAPEWVQDNANLRPNSRRQYESLLRNHLLPAFGAMALQHITREGVRKWHAKTKAKTPSAASGGYRLLRAILNTAVADRRIAESPCHIPKASASGTKERRLPTDAQVRAAADRMPKRLQLAVLLAREAGLRRGEVLALQRRDIDPGTGAIHVQRALTELTGDGVVVGPPKSREGVRTVHIAWPAMETLKRHLREHTGAEPEAWLIAANQGDGPLRPSYLTQEWGKAAKAARMKEVRFHDLRHLHLTEIAQAGATQAELMARGGHSSNAAAATYQHAAAGRDRDLAQAAFARRSRTTPSRRKKKAS